MKLLRWPLLALSALAVGLFRAGRNYHDPLGPRHVGGPEDDTEHRRRVLGAARELRIVTFNIEYAIAVDAAIVVLTTDPGLLDADIVLLQEMDEPSTRRIAAALDMWFVYYPANFRDANQRDFGNAVLTRWPVVDDAKIALPHRSWYADSQRTATAATLRIAGRDVRVYSTHLGTPLDIRRESRAAQLRALLEDADRHELVILGGDMNSATVGQVAVDHGFSWPTRNGPWTTPLGRWDHVLLKGLEPAAGKPGGTVRTPRGISDHRPVWTVAVLPPE